VTTQSTIADPVGPIPPGPVGSARLGWLFVSTAEGLRPVDVLTVAVVTTVTPAVRRVTLTAPADVVAAAGPTLSLLVPRVGDRSPAWPQVARDGRIVWPQGSHGVSMRRYTARRQDPAAGELDVDFVLHGDGPAATWAAAARPGDVLGVASAASLGEAPAGWLLLVGDETALPAIGRILGAAGPTTRGVVLVEVAGPEEEQPLAAPTGVEVRWLHRAGAEPGVGTLLVDAVAALQPPGGDDVFAWVGAESATVRGIRADLRGRWGLRRTQHHAIGYWRRGRAAAGTD
jgi:NADPH-dependent ferric siderophore reductase